MPDFDKRMNYSISIMDAEEIDKLIKLQKDGRKIHDDLWNEFDTIQNKIPTIALANPYADFDDETKKKINAIEKEAPEKLRFIGDEIAKFNKGWMKRVTKQLEAVGGEELVRRFVCARPMGIGGTTASYIVKAVSEMRVKLYYVSAKVYELSHIILELIEKKEGLKYKNVAYVGDYKFTSGNELFRFVFDKDNDRLLLNGHEVRKFKFCTNVYEFFEKGFDHEGEYVYVGKKAAKTIGTIVSKEMNLPKSIRRAFFASHGGFIKFNMKITQLDVICYAKDTEELAELLRKYS